MEISIAVSESQSIGASHSLPTTALPVVISPSTEERVSRITASTASSLSVHHVYRTDNTERKQWLEKWTMRLSMLVN